MLFIIILGVTLIPYTNLVPKLKLIIKFVKNHNFSTVLHMYLYK